MNFRLVIGAVLLPVLIVAFFGPSLAKCLLTFSEQVRYELTDKGRELVAPLSPPSEDFFLGTDKGGRDILSLILYGARWTVGITFILAALKVLIGGLFGISAALNQRKNIHMIKATPLNALPQIVFIYFVLARISINFPFNELILISIFSVIVLIFGTPASAAAIEAVGRELASKEFFTAARASGAGNIYLVTHHILPFLKERLLTLFIGEMISVLNTIGQMGIFGVFLGVTVMTFDPPTYNSRLHEWAGLVGQARFYIYNDQWILFGPLGAYIIFLTSLYMIHEGLKFNFRKTYRIL